MRNLLIYSLLALVFVVGSASAETVILQEDFSTWPTGALTTASSLTAGWSVVENGLSVTTENATMGGKTVKSTAGSSVGCVRGTWSAVDPTTAAPFRLTLYMRMTGSRIEKGAALKSYDNLFTGCSPMLYFCPNTATNVDYRLRDRENCGGAVPSVYAVKDLYQETADKDKMIVWQILCTDVDAKLYKNGVLVKTFAGPPNGTMDNFQAVEIGVPMNVPGTTFPRGSEYGPNGTFWYDFVEVAIGPFPTPTPNLTVLPTSTPTITPTHTPGPLRIDLYGGKPIDTMLRGQNPRRGDGTRLNAVAISRNGCVRGVAGGLDADTYTWTDLTTGVDARNPNVSTLDFLREARDVNAQPLLTANVVGPGYRDATGTWFCQSPSDGWLEKLAADWVLYTNVILQNYRQGDTLPSQYQDLLDSFNWSGKEKLLSATEPLTPKVIYWEIGNEPELGGIGTYIQNHYVSPTDFKVRYKAIAEAMKAVDPSVKLGPCTLTPNNTTTQEYLAHLLSDPEIPVNFLGFHPYYGTLYYVYLYNWGSPDVLEQLESGLRGLKTYQENVASTILGFSASNGFDTSIPWIASEWNSSDWRGTWTPLGKCMTHALGVAEGIFVFANLGYLGAHYWEQPSVGPQGYKMFEVLQDHMGDHLINSYTDGYNFRLYTTRFRNWSKIVLWGINFSDSENKELDIGFTHFPFSVRRVTKMQLGVVGADSGLKSSAGVNWTSTDITGIDLRDFSVTFEDATVTAIVIETEGASVRWLDYD